MAAPARWGIRSAPRARASRDLIGALKKTGGSAASRACAIGGGEATAMAIEIA